MWMVGGSRKFGCVAVSQQCGSDQPFVADDVCATRLNTHPGTRGTLDSEFCRSPWCIGGGLEVEPHLPAKLSVIRRSVRRTSSVCVWQRESALSRFCVFTCLSDVCVISRWQ